MVKGFINIDQLYNHNKVITIICLITLFLIITASSSAASDYPRIDDEQKLLAVKDYQEAVYASWLGQIIGNTYGLCYEFKFIEDSGPNNFPYGYTWTLDLLKEYNGAFSDDDTDIEYMYLTQMEKHGIEPTYYQLAEAWKAHVKTKVWCANRQALTLMHAGHYPPVTGSKEYNTQWMQIDPQLVNEIWAVTAPGMIDYAVKKAEFAAKITNDSFGIEPTLHYAAMYSAAFFEKDINNLIAIGKSALPENSKFAKIIEHVIKLYNQYPNDWEKARKIVKDNYLVYETYNKHAWPPIDALLNGAYGIMALLYGEGDFQKTLDYCCAFGMDADNQAATMCGLLGIVNGLESIPNDLMYPIKELNWEKPFNDSYKVVTRDGLDDATLTGMACRLAEQGDRIIKAKGGVVTNKEGEEYYTINPDAQFTPPFELNEFPKLFTEVDIPFSYPVYTGGDSGKVSLEIIGGLPSGILLSNSRIAGTPIKWGKYKFTILAKLNKLIIQQPIELTVRSQNIAKDAEEILFNTNAINNDIEVIRDGNNDITYSSVKAGEVRETDFYGYMWDEEKEISAITYNNGVSSEYCGWFTSFDVEYLQNDKWVKVENPNMLPDMNLENTQWLKPHLVDYHVSFNPIKTKGIRIIGISGGNPKDAANSHLGLQYYTTISELKVFSK